MAAFVGPLTLKIIADAKALYTELAKLEQSAPKQAKGIADKMKTAFAATAGPGGWIEKSIGDPGRFLSDSVLGGFAYVLKKIPAVGGLLALPFEAAAGAISGLMDLYDAGAKRIKETSDAARQAGVDLGEFQVLANMAGGADKATGPLLKFQRALGQAALAGGAARNAFTSLHLDAADLLAMPLADAFGLVGDRIKALDGRALQAAKAMEILGKGGGALLPVLLRGSAEVDRVRKQLVDFGAAFGEKDVASIRAIDRYMKQFALLKEGLSNQVALGVAPILAEFFARMPDLAEMGITFKGIAEVIINVAEAIGKAGAYIVEYWNDPSQLLKGWEAVFAYIKSGLLALAAEMHLQLARVFISLRLPKSIVLGEMQAYLDLQKAAAAAGADGARLFAEIGATFGETSAGSWMENFWQGVRDRFNGKALEPLADPMDAFWAQRAFEMAEALETPLGKFRKEALDTIQVFRNNPAEAWGIGFQTLGKQLQALRGAVKMPEVRFAGAALEGSTEAYSAILDHRFNATEMSVQEEIKKIQELLLAEAKEQTRQGKELAEALEKDPDLFGGL